MASTLDQLPIRKLAPSLQSFLRFYGWALNFDRYPIPISRCLIELGTWLLNPRPSSQLVEVYERTRLAPHLKIRSWRRRDQSSSSPALLYFHGGGWVLGSSRLSRAFCAMLAEQTQCRVFSVDYRLAPRHPSPAAIEDAELAWEWLCQTTGSSGRERPALLVGGDSAGGNLATVLCRRLRDQHRTMPDGQFLIYPVTDQSHDFASYPLGGKDHLLTPALMGWFQSHYLSPQNRDHPDVSPLKASSLEGLPPAFIALSAFDILHHQGEQYAAKLAAAGVPVRVAAFPNMMHGFVNLLRYPEASQAAMECAEGLRELVAVIREKALVAPTPDQVSA